MVVVLISGLHFVMDSASTKLPVVDHTH